MSDKHKNVLIAAYLFEDLAKQDFDAVLKLAEQKTITVEGVVLTRKKDLSRARGSAGGAGSWPAGDMARSGGLGGA